MAELGRRSISRAPGRGAEGRQGHGVLGLRAAGLGRQGVPLGRQTLHRPDPCPQLGEVPDHWPARGDHARGGTAACGADHRADRGGEDPVPEPLGRSGRFGRPSLSSPRGISRSTLEWERVDREAMVFRVDETKTGTPLELPITRQFAAILERRWEESGHLPAGWVFPSTITGMATSAAWPSTTRPSPRRAARSSGTTACATRSSPSRSATYAAPCSDQAAGEPRPAQRRDRGLRADWTIAQLRGPAQEIADRIEELMSDRTESATTDEVAITYPEGLGFKSCPHNERKRR